MFAIASASLAFSLAPAPRVLPAATAARHLTPVASFDRREFATLTSAAAALCISQPTVALASEDIKKVVVAGATGQTGRRCLQRLAATSGVSAIGGVRDPAKAAKKLAESKI